MLVSEHCMEMMAARKEMEMTAGQATEQFSSVHRTEQQNRLETANMFERSATLTDNRKVIAHTALSAVMSCRTTAAAEEWRARASFECRRMFTEHRRRRRR